MASDTEGFKYRANITINTNLNESTGRRTLKAWLSVSRSSVILLCDCRVPPFPPPLSFGQKE